MLDGVAVLCVQFGFLLGSRLLIKEQVAVLVEMAFARVCVVWQLCPFLDQGALLTVTHVSKSLRIWFSVMCSK